MDGLVRAQRYGCLGCGATGLSGDCDVSLEFHREIRRPPRRMEVGSRVYGSSRSGVWCPENIELPTIRL